MFFNLGWMFWWLDSLFGWWGVLKIDSIDKLLGGLR